MRDTGTNKGGWGASNVQANLNSKTASTDGSINLKNIEDVIGSNLIKKVKKNYIDQDGSAYNSTSSKIKESEDYLWLLSCSEIWSDGAQYNGSSWVKTPGCYGYAGASEGNQYKYYASIGKLTYASGNPKVIKYSASNSGVWCWLRSPNSNNNNNFCNVNNNGNANNNNASNSNGVAPGFHKIISKT